MKTFVMGDSHGAHKAVQQALKEAQYDPTRDKLIVLGDTQDGWSQAPELTEMYMKLETICEDRFIYILGNHDAAFIEWYDGGCRKHIMYGHGAAVTTHIYLKLNEDWIGSHAEWYRRQRHCYLDDQNRFFVHAGWDAGFTFDNPVQYETQEYLWNRSFWDGMFKGRNYAKDINEVYIGHSPTVRYKPFEDKPMNRRNVWNLDTGAAFTGRVTVMDIDTKEFWQSDKCKDLYPLERGRN